jgi:hypothetical protein
MVIFEYYCQFYKEILMCYIFTGQVEECITRYKVEP